MNTEEMGALLNKIGKVTSRAYWEDNKVSLEGEPGLGEDIDGSFAYIYKAVKDSKIKLLTKDGQVVGINFDAGVDNLIDDNRLGKIFSDIYEKLPAENYVKTAMILVASNTLVGPIVEDYITGNAYIVLPQDKKVIDVYGNTIATADEKLYFIEDITEDLERKAQAHLENTIQKEEEDYDGDCDGDCENCEYFEDCEECEDCDCEDCEECGCEDCDYCKNNKDELELPKQVIIKFFDLGYEITLSRVKRYLREKYDHYLSGLHSDPEMVYDTEACIVFVTNIHWGRKRS